MDHLGYLIVGEIKIRTPPQALPPPMEGSEPRPPDTHPNPTKRKITTFQAKVTTRDFPIRRPATGQRPGAMTGQPARNPSRTQKATPPAKMITPTAKWCTKLGLEINSIMCLRFIFIRSVMCCNKNKKMNKNISAFWTAKPAGFAGVTPSPMPNLNLQSFTRP